MFLLTCVICQSLIPQLLLMRYAILMMTKHTSSARLDHYSISFWRWSLTFGDDPRFNLYWILVIKDYGPSLCLPLFRSCEKSACSIIASHFERAGNQDVTRGGRICDDREEDALLGLQIVPGSFKQQSTSAIYIIPK
ncbi:hypothetical protein VTO42DRAFT_2821 [Malbranchea cinnamomea]